MIKIITVVSINLCPEPEFIGMRKGEEIFSSIRKRPVDGPAEVGEFGFVGDSQADLTVHGGKKKAVYCYSAKNFDKWNTWRDERNATATADNQLELVFGPGVLGENLTLSDWDESSVFIGDRYAVCSPQGELRGMTLVVSGPRQPCFKQNLIANGSSAAMVKNCLCGGYCEVEGIGEIHVGDVLYLTQRLSGAEALVTAYRRKMRANNNQPH